MRNAKAGKEAWTVIKLNSLSDRTITRKLYEASQVGVKITIIARGISILIPGIPGVSDNIEAFSIVDKYLEHSRIYVFANDGKKEFYISSADWMQRNFDYRIEVTVPIFDADIKEELWTMLQIQMADNTKARLLNRDAINKYRTTGSDKPVRSQLEIYNYFRQKLTSE